MTVASILLTAQSYAGPQCKHEYHARGKAKKVTHDFATRLQKTEKSNLAGFFSRSSESKQVEPLRDYEIDFKILIISATDSEENDPGLQAAKSFLENMWIPYEVLVLTQNGERDYSKRLQLTNPDGSGRYFGIITTEGQLTYKNKSTRDYTSALSESEWKLLYNYESRYKVRQVSLFSSPSEELGVEEIKGVNHDEDDSLYVDDVMKDYTGGFVDEAKLFMKDNWHTPVNLINRYERNIIPIAYFNNKPGSIAGTVNKFEDGREQMHFYFAQTKSTSVSKTIAPIWIKWLTKNVYVGKRRVYFTAQIDDYFLSTACWDVKHKRDPNPGENVFRTSEYDIENFLKFQNGELRTLTKDPNYKVELAFNGYGVIDNGGLVNDKLYINAIKNANQFNWVSHTYTHADLTNISYSALDQELKNNISLAKIFLANLWHTYSENSIVTPAITGLFNPNALRAIADNGIKFVIGDNSRPELVSLTNKHWGRYTTSATNGYAGILIVPRFPVDVFYNASNFEELTSEFNKLFREDYDRPQTLAQILARNARDASENLFEYNYAPYMFHQANLRYVTYGSWGSESLLSKWFKDTIEAYRRVSTLPMMSAQFKQINNLYLQRMQYDQCGVSTRFVVRKNKLDQVKVKSKNKCIIPITGIGEAETITREPIALEYYGPDKTINVSSQGENVETTIVVKESKRI